MTKTKTKRNHLLMLILLLGVTPLHPQQQHSQVVVNAEVQQFLWMRIDGSDPGWGYTLNETCNLGLVDARGTAISGAPVGDPNVNGTAGIAVDSGGVPVSGFEDPACVGSFYPLFSASGGNSWNSHPTSILGINMFCLENWQLLVQASMTAQTINVTLNQLKWKLDATAANGWIGYTDFTASSTLISTGGFFLGSFYVDYGLLVEFADQPGVNIWTITYTLTTL